MFMGHKSRKRGSSVYLSLTGKARETIWYIKPTELGEENGLEIILLNLGSLFLKDGNTTVHITFKEFHNFRISLKL